MWITDRERGSYSRYGSIAAYAPLRAVRTIDFSAGRDGGLLHVQLEPEGCWDIPISPENMREAADFSAFVAGRIDLQVYPPNLITVSIRSGENLM